MLKQVVCKMAHTRQYLVCCQTAFAAPCADGCLWAAEQKALKALTGAVTKFEGAAAKGVPGAPRAAGLGLLAMAELMPAGDPDLEVTLTVRAGSSITTWPECNGGAAVLRSGAFSRPCCDSCKAMLQSACPRA